MVLGTYTRTVVSHGPIVPRGRPQRLLGKRLSVASASLAMRKVFAVVLADTDSRSDSSRLLSARWSVMFAHSCAHARADVRRF